MRCVVGLGCSPCTSPRSSAEHRRGVGQFSCSILLPFQVTRPDQSQWRQRVSRGFRGHRPWPAAHASSPTCDFCGRRTGPMCTLRRYHRVRALTRAKATSVYLGGAGSLVHLLPLSGTSSSRRNRSFSSSRRRCSFFWRRSSLACSRANFLPLCGYGDGMTLSGHAPRLANPAVPSTR